MISCLSSYSKMSASLAVPKVRDANISACFRRSWSSSLRSASTRMLSTVPPFCDPNSSLLDNCTPIRTCRRPEYLTLLKTLSEFHRILVVVPIAFSTFADDAILSQHAARVFNTRRTRKKVLEVLPNHRQRRTRPRRYHGRQSSHGGRSGNAENEDCRDVVHRAESAPEVAMGQERNRTPIRLTTLLIVCGSNQHRRDESREPTHSQIRATDP